MPGIRQPRDAIGADVFQIKIAKNHVRDAVGLGLRNRSRHFALIDLVRAGKRDAHHDRAKPCGLELRAQQTFAHTMHAHAGKIIGHRRQRTHDVVIAAAANFVQGEGTVLAARPGDQRLGLVLLQAGPINC